MCQGDGRYLPEVHQPEPGRLPRQTGMSARWENGMGGTEEQREKANEDTGKENRGVNPTGIQRPRTGLQGGRE